MTAKASSTAVLGLYLVLSIVLTWPVILGIGSDVPGDLGDSLLNMWILGWGVEHVPMLLTGSISWTEFWNANIFHPDPLALALSEHLFGQTLQILPVYWLTGNIILCYNLLFISTFALSGFGTYLLVRDLTGDRRAAFIAGLIYGFLPYRIASVPHVQVMSSQWMPFALYGLNKFLSLSEISAPGRSARDIRRAKAGALAVGTGALVLQNWSCGYYLLYFAPFVPLFVLHRMWTNGQLKNWSIWGTLAVAGLLTLALSLPFLFPYQAAQQAFGIERPFGEVVLFSANVWSYITASENLTLWGKTLRFYPHGEGETFLGFVPWLLAGVALVSLFRSGFSQRFLGARRRFCAGVRRQADRHLVSAPRRGDPTDSGAFCRDLRWLRCPGVRPDNQRAHAAAPADAVRRGAGLAADRVAAREGRGREDHAFADRIRAGGDHSRDVALARPVAECRRVPRLRLWPVRRAL